MALTRLTDRPKIDDNGKPVTNKNGEPVMIKRFGLWGTTAEIEIDGKMVEVIQKNGTRTKFKTKQEAEDFLKTLL